MPVLGIASGKPSSPIRMLEKEMSSEQKIVRQLLTAHIARHYYYYDRRTIESECAALYQPDDSIRRSPSRSQGHRPRPRAMLARRHLSGRSRASGWFRVEARPSESPPPSNRSSRYAR